MKKILPNIILLLLSFIIAAGGFYGFFVYAKKPAADLTVSTGENLTAARAGNSASPSPPEHLSARDQLILKPLPLATGPERQAGEFPTGSFAEFARPRPPLRIDQAPGEATSAVQQNGSAEECTAIPAVRTASLLQAYRGGLIEINEKEENADRIVTAALDWVVSCQKSGDAVALAVSSTLKLAGNEPIALSLEYQVVSNGIHLRDVTVSLGPSAAKSFVFTGLEVRPTGQKRGAPVNVEVETSRPGMAKFKLASRGDGAGGEVSRLLRNAQWVDFPLALGNRKFILAVELPVAQALMPN